MTTGRSGKHPILTYRPCRVEFIDDKGNPLGVIPGKYPKPHYHSLKTAEKDSSMNDEWFEEAITACTERGLRGFLQGGRGQNLAFIDCTDGVYHSVTPEYRQTSGFD